MGAAIVNALLNGGIGWAVTRGLPTFPAWKLPGVAGDLVATAFGVSFGTVLAMALQIRFDVSRGKISPFPPPASLAQVLARVPRAILPRSIVLGAFSVPVFATPALVWLALSGQEALTRTAFVWLKGGLAAVEGGLVTPFIVLCALGDVAIGKASSEGAPGSTPSATP